MIMEATMLIIGDEEESLMPLRTSTKRFVNLFDERLTLCDIMNGMIIIRSVGQDVEVLGLDHSVIGKHSVFRILEKRKLVRMEIVQDILQLSEVSVEQSVGDLLVIDPECQPRFFYNFEDGLLWHSFREQLRVVAHQSMRSCGMQILSIGLC